MSEKPKVYQGVRVKTTVKELLQRRRAQLAAVKTLTPEFPQQEDFVSTLPAHYYGSCTEDSNGAAPQAPPSRAFPDPPSSTLPLDTVFQNQQLLNMLLAEESFSPALPPFQPWPYGHPSPGDYYSHIMPQAPSSPSESLNQQSPVDCSGYSPQPSSSPSSSSSSSSSCYSSPNRMESCYGFPPEQYYCQNCSLHPCYCLPHWSVGPTDCLPPLDYGAYGQSDCQYTSSLQDSCFRRDINSEMCYL